MASGVSRERKRNCFESLDRFNSLPEDVIMKILTYLPIREAVTTSRLSRIWRYRWRSIPELVFSEHSTQQTFDQWVNFINNVLLLHDGDITKFKIQYLLDSASSNVDQWLQLLSRKKLTDLFISFQPSASYMCPTSLFYFQDLKTLLLARCVLQLPPQIQFNGFKNLLVLGLRRVSVNKETIEFLVNNCPLLRSLAIVTFESIISNLSINAPNLRTCIINGEFEGITSFKTPKLVSVHIRTWVHRKVARCKLDGILGLVQLRNATFYHPFFEFLSMNNFGERLSIIYCQLRHLSLYIDFEDSKQILAALWLFRSSPFLKTVNIGVKSVDKDVYNEDLCVGEFYKTLLMKGLVLSSLETFNLEEFGGSTNEFEFIQFLLLKATVLQTMKIQRKQKDAGRIRITREKALLRFEQLRRTSLGLKIELPGWEQDV